LRQAAPHGWLRRMGEDTAYGAHANPDLLARVPRTARRVLDVGCGAGGLGAALKAAAPDIEVIGIEPDPILAERAARHYAAVHRINIETEAPPVPHGKLDAMLFGDVLEHLVDPGAVLARDRGLLAPGGRLLICVPNVEHWSFVAHLLLGSWRPEPQGLRDRTHLTWFTRAGMLRLLGEAGYRPLEARPRIFRPEDGRAFAERFAPALAALGVDREEWLGRALPLQWVFVAVPA
jgi:SAM-dependent methyltransferase